MDENTKPQSDQHEHLQTPVKNKIPDDKTEKFQCQRKLRQAKHATAYKAHSKLGATAFYVPGKRTTATITTITKIKSIHESVRVKIPASI